MLRLLVLLVPLIVLFHVVVLLGLRVEAFVAPSRPYQQTFQC
jgi:hypothetical protein